MDAAQRQEIANNYDSAALMSKEDETRLYNEVIIHHAKGLPMSEDGTAPSAFVYFMLLGNPDSLTNPVHSNANPEFNEKFSFPMVTTDQQLRLVQRFKLTMAVVDMKLTLEDSFGQKGLLGEVTSSLADLADGIPQKGVCNIRHNEKTGELQLSIGWKYPLRKQHEAVPYALSGISASPLVSWKKGWLFTLL